MIRKLKSFAFVLLTLISFLFLAATSAKAVDPCVGGTLGYWSMTEGSGNIIHDSCNGFDGNWIQGVNWATDSDGPYLQFSGGDGKRITIPRPALSQNTSVTVELKMKPGTPGAGNRVISQMQPPPFESGNHLRFTLVVNGSYLQIWGQTGDGTFGFCGNNNCLPADQWTHVAFQINGTDVRLYYDGVLVGTGTMPYPQTLRATDAVTEIGTGEGISGFDGRIQYVRISQGVRSDFLLNRVQPPPPPPPPPTVNPCAGGTLGYWSMTEGSGNLIHDICSGYNGSWTSAVNWATDSEGPYLQFAGGGDRGIMINQPALSQNTSITVELRMMPGSQGSSVIRQAYPEPSAPGSLRFQLIDGSFLQIWGQTGDGTFSFCGSPGCLPTSQWTHVAFQIDGTQVRLYYNGILINSGVMPFPQTLRATNATTEFGRDFFNGRIQFVRISQGIRNDFLLTRNQSPVANAGGPYFVAEGGTVALSGSGSDPNGDPITFAWDLDNNGTFETPGQNVTFSAASLDGPSTRTVNLQVCDNHGACATASAVVNVTNVPPTATFGPIPATIDEGGATALSFSNQLDPSPADTTAGFRYSYDCTNDGVFELTDGLAASFSCSYPDNGIFTARGRIKDKDGGFTDYPVAVIVNNVAPTVGAITAPTDPLLVNSTVNASASFMDPGVLDTHTAVWNWGDGTSSAGLVTETNGSVTGSHTYTAAGVYTLQLTVTDKDGGSGQNSFSFVVIFDSTAGFVTGAGIIDSPAGAFPQDPSLTGRANFGFSAKYLPGDIAPSGGSQFKFRLAGINFSGTNYQWLVISGAKATFKGIGTNNGSGNFTFLVATIDGTPDRYRIKITDNTTNTVFYDNEMGTSETADPTSPLLNGNIVIH